MTSGRERAASRLGMRSTLLLGVAALAGSVDVDAITLSLAGDAQQGEADGRIPLALAAVILTGGRRRRRAPSGPAGPAAQSAPATSTEDPAQ